MHNQIYNFQPCQTVVIVQIKSSITIHTHVTSQAYISQCYDSSSALMLRLLSVSQVDAVSVLGTLNKDKAAVPGDWKAAVALKSAGTGRGAIR